MISCCCQSVPANTVCHYTCRILLIEFASHYFCGMFIAVLPAISLQNEVNILQ